MYIEYVNARVRGMKSNLFGPEFIDKLLLKPDIDSIITELVNSPYKKDIEQASLTYSGIQCIENALRLNLLNTYRLIFKLVHGEHFEKYILILFNKWDIHNIKTIVRGKNIHLPKEEILECLIPAGELDEVTLIEMIKQQDNKSLIDLLASWNYKYAIPLTRSYQEYLTKRDLAVLEYALDMYYYKNALHQVSGNKDADLILSDLLATEIDIINLKTAFRFLKDRIDPKIAENYFLGGGKKLPVRLLLEYIQMKNIKEFVSSLVSTPYSFLTEIPADVVEVKGLSVYEKELERFLIKKELSTYRLDPLSIAPIIGYLSAKNVEIVNLRIISRCKTILMDEEELRKDLIHV